MFRLPSLFKQDNKQKISLKVNSDLVGVKTTLPAPLLKQLDEPLPSRLEFDQAERFMDLQFGQLLSLRYKKDTHGPFRLRAIELGDHQTTEQNETGLTVGGTVSEFPVKPWLSLYQQFAVGDGKQDSGKQGSKSLPVVDVTIDALQWPVWPAEQVELQAFYKDSDYHIDIQSSLGGGLITVPENRDSPITMVLGALTLPKSEKGADLKLDPRTFRPFDFAAGKLDLKGFRVKNIKVQGSNFEKGMSFDQIHFEAQDLNVDGTGAWYMTNTEEQQSQFDLQLDSIDVEDSMEDLGFAISLGKGELNSRINVEWPGGPHEFELNNMFGTATLDLRDGVVKEVEPGAGRLLALLNLGKITRRLSLDFSDVTKKGFTFDSILGDLTLSQGGKLQSKKIAIKASAADIDMIGSTNIVDRTYDQSIYVTPKVGGSLPVAGAVVGGPVGAAAGVLAERVASVVGLNKVTQSEYKMTGSWDEPTITRVKKKKAEKAATAAPPSGQPPSPGSAETPPSQ